MGYEVWLRGADGKNCLVSYQGLKNDLGICELERRLDALTRRIEILERPLRKEKALDLLKDGSAHTWPWLQRRVPGLGFGDREELIADGKIVSEWHGKVQLWKLKEV